MGPPGPAHRTGGEMTEHWHNIASGGALPLASSLSVALAWQDSTPRLTRPLPADSAGPEMPLTVTFEGLNEPEIQRALHAFPGGTRFKLMQIP